MRGDVVARTMRLIADGTVDREGVGGLAAHLGYTTRQLERLLQAEVGAGPLALARAQRAQTARVLIETTDLPFGDVAFAAGFSSIRQFNDTVRSVFENTPRALRQRATTRSTSTPNSPGTVCLRLPVRTPFAYAGAFGHLAASTVPGCEEVRDGAYRRSLRLPFGNAIVTLSPAVDHVRCVLVLDDFRDLTTAIARCRRLLDLDADPDAVDEALSDDAELCAVVAKAPGQRIPRTVDEAELAVRAVLGQQVSTKAASTHAGRLVAAYGQPINDPDGTLTHTFPSVAQLADIDPIHLAVPKTRQRTLSALVAGLADGSVVLSAGCDWENARTQLLALPGIGPWTAEVIAMRGLGDPGRVPRQRSRLTPGRRTAGPAVRRTLTRRAQCAVATLAFLCHPIPLDDSRTSGEPLAATGGRMIEYRTIDSPIGLLTLAGRGSVLTNLRMVDQTYEPSRTGWSPNPQAFGEAVAQLDAYFAGELTDFDFEFDLRGSEFQRRVWKALQTIPYGETRCYGQIADQIGATGSARAVGLANGHNPIAIVVPCHRVIGANGGLTGYGGGLDRKRTLLDMERSRTTTQTELTLFD